VFHDGATGALARPWAVWWPGVDAQIPIGKLAG